MRIFILEDQQPRIDTFKRKLIGHELIVTDNVEDAIRILGGQTFDLMFLDHDLGGQEMVSVDDKNTGSELARWIAYETWVCPPIIVHSLNPDGARYMVGTLNFAGLNCIRIPFTELVSRFDDPSFITQ